MSSYSEFRKIVGLKGKEIEKITGYTRQGLDYSFGMIDEGKTPKKRFLISIDEVINKRITEEIKQHEERISRLRELQGKYTELGE